MELQQVSNNIIPRVINNFRQSKEIPEFTVKPFVEANTVKTNLKLVAFDNVQDKKFLITLSPKDLL